MRRICIVSISILCMLSVCLSVYGLESRETVNGLQVKNESVLFRASVPIRVVIKSENLWDKSFEESYEISNMGIQGPIRVVDFGVVLNPEWYFCDSIQKLKIANERDCLLVLNGLVISKENRDLDILGSFENEDGKWVIPYFTNGSFIVSVVVPNQSSNYSYSLAALILTVDFDRADS